MAHLSLRGHVETTDELYELLQRLQSVAMSSVGWRAIACVACLAGGLIEPGVIGKTALCLSALAGMAWAWAMADYVARDSLMELITLQDLIRPQARTTEVGQDGTQ